MNIKNMNTKIKKRILSILVIIICSFFTISAVIAVTNFFARQKHESIKLVNGAPIFEVNRISGNNYDKYLIPTTMPNVNPERYVYTISIDHQAILRKNGFDINIPLYLKINTWYDTHGTFKTPEEYFVLELKTNSQIHNETNRPQMNLNSDGTGTIPISIKVQQTSFIFVNNPKLTLVLDYELVDKDGNALSGCTQTIKNTIININTNINE
ncbi:MAG: hypothetical protein Q8885_02485 [Candidatus Phytoplasma stylosanthis]|nr:hypothetical protein [Candidatus Phytoplasma stylosanthis]